MGESEEKKDLNENSLEKPVAKEISNKMEAVASPSEVEAATAPKEKEEKPPFRERIRNLWNKCRRNVTVEPLLCLVWFPFGLAFGSGATTKLDLWKACIVGVGLNDTVCDNIRDEEYDSYENQVQRYLNDFDVYYGYADSVPGILVAVFAGALSDRFGRKPLLIVPLIGWTIWTVLFAVHLAFIRVFPMEFKYTNIFTSFFGGGTILYMAIYSIITDVTEPHERAQRLAVVDAFDWSSYFLGTLLSPYYFKAFGYPGIAIASGVGMLTSIPYAFFCLKETRPPREKKEKVTAKKSNCQKTKSVLLKYGVKPLKDFWGCLTRKRRGYRRFYLYIELSIYLCYRFCTMYHAQTYLYLSKVFPEEFSMELYALIKNISTAMTVFSLLFIMPLLLRTLKLNELTISTLNCVMCTKALVLAAFARNIMPEYVLAFSLTIIQASQWSLIRTTVTKTVTKGEVATIFSAMALLGEMTPMLINTLVKKVYNATLEIFPSAYMIMAACFYVFAAVLNYTLFLVRHEIDDTEGAEEEEIEEQEMEEKKVDEEKASSSKTD